MALEACLAGWRGPALAERVVVAGWRGPLWAEADTLHAEGVARGEGASRTVEPCVHGCRVVDVDKLARSD